MSSSNASSSSPSPRSLSLCGFSDLTYLLESEKIPLKTINSSSPKLLLCEAQTAYLNKTEKVYFIALETFEDSEATFYGITIQYADPWTRNFIIKINKDLEWEKRPLDIYSHVLKETIKQAKQEIWEESHKNRSTLALICYCSCILPRLIGKTDLSPKPEEEENIKHILNKKFAYLFYQ